MKVYEMLAQLFVRENVDCCFALLGDANMNWATTLESKGCRFVYLRHEHCAVSAAMAWSRNKNAVGVATVTCGPGVTQILTALPAAVRAHIPLLIFAGEAPLKSPWYNQAIKQAPLVEATGAAYHELHHVESMAREVRDAFLQAKTEQRPVVIGVPLDLQNLDLQNPHLQNLELQNLDLQNHTTQHTDISKQTIDNNWPAPSSDLIANLQPCPPNPYDLEHAAQRISAAQKIVIMAGRGAVDAGAEQACERLAELSGALLATTLPARGLFFDDPFYLGVVGGFASETTRTLISEADLIVAVGASLAQHNTDGGKLLAAEKTLHIDLRPATLNQGRIAASMHLQGDALLCVEALILQLENTSHQNTNNKKALWRNDDIKIQLQAPIVDSESFPPIQGLLDPRDVVAALDEALPRDWYMVNSSGHCSFYFSHMHRRPQNRFLTIREFGAIGNGLSYAIGVAAAQPESTVVLFDGDGSLLMHAQELETVARCGLKLLICVMNDGAYGSEIHKLRAEGLSDKGAVFGYPALDKLATGFELAGKRIAHLGQLPAALHEFKKADKATLWDFHIADNVVSPVIRRAHPAKHG